ncbi:MAG: acyl-CoA dehydrogenase [Neisseriaceae bacterium]|nr:acyl-CoA dehydrogenase [Neisseriaceae bacterium]
MSQYNPPLDDLRFALRTHANIDEVLALPTANGVDLDTVDAILDEASKFASANWSECNRTGDINGARLDNGTVHSDPSFAQAYKDFCEAGWNSLLQPEEFGGQALPSTISAACDEMWYGGNLSLSLLPMLTGGASAAINAHASDAIKQKFLPNMTSGVWSGTMNLTEPQAGTDLSKVASKAVPNGDDTYAVSGQKIFITWGEHELAENIIHLVLARLPDAAPGVKGISLFVVPKYWVNDDGSLGERNKLQCVAIEHKMGIHGSPTCVMQFEGARGYLVGEAGKGLNYMFTMMNHARLCVGIEGHAVAERAFQHALAYTKERVQSKPIDGSSADAVTIIHHPDIRRMLLTQKATLEAQRAMFLMTASMLDKAHSHPNPEEAQKAQALVDFMIPIVKASCTENGTTLTNMALQCFGGMGFVEETGAAQFVRDVRITAIYEGTNGVQALDLIGRKTASNGGQSAGMVLQMAKDTNEQLRKIVPEMAKKLDRAIDLAQQTVQYVVQSFNDKKPELAATGSLPYLMQMAVTIGAVMSAKSYVAATEALKDLDNAVFSESFYRNKLATVQVYFDYVLPQVESYAIQVLSGAQSILNIDVERI